MAGAGSSTGPLGIGALGGVGLINNSQRGEWLVVWDIQIVVLPNPIPNALIIADLNICTGRAPGSLLIANNSNPLASNVARLPGTNWTVNSGGNELGAIINSITLLISGNYAYYQWLHDWPVCAIAPGDSAVVYSDGNAYRDFGVGYLYEVVPSAP
jgi:hypothetical protein